MTRHRPLRTVPAPASHALLLDVDAPLQALLEEWLAPLGVRLADAAAAGARYAFIVVDVPFPRHAGAERLRAVARAHPGTPIFLLSASFFSGIESDGAVARLLGATRVLPKPLTRDALLAALATLGPSGA